MNAYCTWLDDLINAIRARDSSYGYRTWWDDADVVDELGLRAAVTRPWPRFYVKSATLLVEPWTGKCVGENALGGPAKGVRFVRSMQS